MALTDSLDELITSGALTPQLAMKILQQVRRGGPLHGLLIHPISLPPAEHSVRQVIGGHYGEAGEDEDHPESMSSIFCAVCPLTMVSATFRHLSPHTAGLPFLPMSCTVS